MTILPALLFFAQVAVPATDSITMEVVTAGPASSGWTLRADESGRWFRSAPAIDQSNFVAPKGTYAFVAKRLAAYRKLAREGAGCPTGASEVMAYRFTWIDHGVRRTATFSDSCGGTPENIFAVLRPIAQRLDRVIARPPGADAPTPE